MRHISRCFSNKLTEICAHATKLEEINLTLIDYLPNNLREHCHVGSFRNGCLILVTADSVWASQLRYILPDLRDKLRTEAKLYQLASIKIIIDVDQLSTPNRLSKETISVKEAKRRPSPWQDALDYLQES